MPKTGGKLCKIGLMLTLLIGALLRLWPINSAPILPNEGILLTVASELNFGKLIYRDLFWEQMPALPVALAPFFRLSPETGLFFVRMLSVSAGLVSICLVYALAKEIAKRSTLIKPNYVPVAGLIGAFFVAFSPIHILWSYHVNPELFGMCLSLAAALYFFRGWGKRHWALWVTTGAFSAIAFSISYSTGIIALVIFVIWIIEVISRKDIYYLKAFLAFSVGGILVISPLLMQIGLRHVAGDFLQLMSSINLRLDPISLLSQNVGGAGLWLASWPVMIPAYGVLFGKTKQAPIRLFFISWLILEFVFLFLHKNISFDLKDFSVHLLPIIFLFSILGGSGFAILFSQASINGQRLLWIPLAQIVCIVVVLPAADVARQANNVSIHLNWPAESRDADQEVAFLLETLTEPGETILVLGNPGFHIEGKRSVATRFFHIPDNLEDTFLKHSVDAELVAAISHQRPGAILLSNSYLDRLSPAILDAIDDRWRLMAKIDHEHQQGLLLYLPSGYEYARALPVKAGKQFENGATLHSVYTKALNSQLALIETTWLLDRSINQDHEIEIQVLDRSQKIIGETEFDAFLENRPVTAWRPGETITNVQIIPIDFGLDADAYHEIHITFLNNETHSPVDLVDGQGNFVSIPFNQQFVQQ